MVYWSLQLEGWARTTKCGLHLSCDTHLIKDGLDSFIVLNIFIQTRNIRIECCSVVSKQEGVLEGVLLLAGEVFIYQLLNVALHSSMYVQRAL